MKVVESRTESNAVAGDFDCGMTFMYDGYLYMALRVGCKDFEHEIPDGKICAVNLKSGTMRLLTKDLAVLRMESEVSSFPISLPSDRRRMAEDFRGRLIRLHGDPGKEDADERQ